MPNRRLEELPAWEALRLLSSVWLGRVVFTAQALPAIRPVSHLVDGDHIVIRTDGTVPITSALRAGADTVVAYEADSLDPLDHLGWSVSVVGLARQVTESGDVARYLRALPSWGQGTKDQVIAIRADVVTGFRLVADGAGAHVVPAARTEGAPTSSARMMPPPR